MKKESSLIQTIVDGTTQWIHKETRILFNALHLNPTPENPKLGFCNDCDPNRIRFINQLINWEDDTCCFIQGHDIETIAGIPWKQTNKYKEQLTDELFYESLEGTPFELEVPK